jgi:probable rRNA maturation factor
VSISQTFADLDFTYRGFLSLKRWLIEVIKKENFIPGALTIVYCSDEYLYNMNREYLKHEYYTDIITFDYSTGNTVSGDLFISIQRVEDNSLRYGINFKKELDRVILHGILHLMGYVDDSDNGVRIMRGKEEHYLGLR